MSLAYLKEAIENGDSEKLIRYVRLHFGDGNEEKGAKEIDKAWIEALKPMLEIPPTDREFILQTLAEKDVATLAHLFFHLAFLLRPKIGRMDSRWKSLRNLNNCVRVCGRRLMIVIRIR